MLDGHFFYPYFEICVFANTTFSEPASYSKQQHHEKHIRSNQCSFWKKKLRAQGSELSTEYAIYCSFTGNPVKLRY